MTSWFLQRNRAKLATAQVLGALDRMIRKRLKEASDGELWVMSLSLSKRCKELAALDSPQTNPSMGARYRAWRDHPFRKYLDEQEQRRYPPERGPLCDLSIPELKDYIRWFQSKPPDAVDRLSIEDRLAMWKRERGRILPVLPRPGSLPSNAHGRRLPRETSRPILSIPETEEGETPQGEEESRSIH